MSTTQFTITQQHIDLLHNANWQWNNGEFGAPGIDPKRPYGSSSVYSSIAAILDIHPEIPCSCDEWCDCDGSFSMQQIDLMDRLHRELLTVLRIVLEAGTVQPGTYQREVKNRMLGDWERVEEE